MVVSLSRFCLHLLASESVIWNHFRTLESRLWDFLRNIEVLIQRVAGQCSWERTLAPLHSGGEIGPTTVFGQRPRQRPASAEMTDEGKARVSNASLSVREFTGG